MSTDNTDMPDYQDMEIDDLIQLDPLPALEDMLAREQHIDFVRHFIATNNKTKAAKHAGYSERSAKQLGYQTFTRLDVTKAIAVERERLRRKYDVTIDTIQAEYATMAYSDISDYHEVDSLDDLATLPREMRAAIQEITINETRVDTDTETTLTDENGVSKETEQCRDIVNRTVKLKMHSKTAALEGLARMNGAFTANVNIQGAKIIIEE
jgi:phage terminase small subunit